MFTILMADSCSGISFFVHGVDCNAPGASAYHFEIVDLATFIMLKGGKFNSSLDTH